MATFTVTAANWNDAGFWSSISADASGHVLDFSSLGSDYTVSWETDHFYLSDSVNTFIVGDSTYTGPFHALMPAPTVSQNFDRVLGSEGNDLLKGDSDPTLIEGGLGNDTIYGEGGNDTIEGGLGNDSLYGGDGEDSFLAGDGDDFLYGGEGVDTLDAGPGNDSIDGNPGDDIILGREGNDSVESGSGNDSVVGGLGDDSMNGDLGNDTIYGGIGNDFVRGSYDNDLLYGGVGDDFVWGGWGDDTLVFENDFGNDTITAEGVHETLGDTMDLTAITDAVSFDLTHESPEIGTFSDGVSTANYEEVEIILLASGINTLIMADFGGIDRVTGFKAPTDMGDGTYTGVDQLDVSGITSDYGTTPVNVADVVVSEDADGNAVLMFFEGVGITLVGVPASAVSSAAQLEAMGVPPAPAVPDFIVEGTAGDDDITTAYDTDPDGDRIDNADHSDGSDDDSVTAGAGNDTVLSGAGSDTVLGEDGDDQLSGEAGPDSLLGGVGADTLTGGAGNDTLDGGDGSDRLEGGIGDDSLNGAGGDDRFALTDGFGIDALTGGETGETVGDTLDLSGLTTGATVTLSATESGTVTTGANTATFVEVENVLLGAGQDTVTLTAGSGTNTVTDFDLTDGGDGRTLDQLEVSALTSDGGATPITTADVTVSDDGNGNAVLTFPGGVELTLAGVAPASLATVAQLEAIGIPPAGPVPDFVVDGTTGDDEITDAYTGDPEGDRVDGLDNATGGNADSIAAGAGNDTVVAGAGDDTVLGEAGADLLEGSAGDDSVSGGAGDDTLSGGAGADTLQGDAGNDSFTLGSGDAATGGDGDDIFHVGPGGLNGGALTLDGGETGETAGDTLNIRGPATIEQVGESGTVTWLDGSALSFSNIENVNYTACFSAGTKIKTMTGEVPVEHLRCGDRVLTRDNGFQPVRWAGQRLFSGAELTYAPHLAPILIKAGALGENVPERDLLVSPQHRVLINDPSSELWFGEGEVLVAAKDLTMLDGVERVHPSKGVHYVHILFDHHEIVVSDGTWTESFQPGDFSLSGFDSEQRSEIYEIFPELSKGVGNGAYPPARYVLKPHQAQVLFGGVV